MPRGGARARAGRPRLSAEEHFRRGTYRPDRHGPLSRTLLEAAATASAPIQVERTNVLTMPARPGGAPASTSADDWAPTAGERLELSPRAQARLREVLETFRLDTLEGARLLDALRSLTRIERLEVAVSSSGVASRRGKALLGHLQREQRLFVTLWNAIGLPGK